MSLLDQYEAPLEATEGCAGRFDVVFSNPPYQIQSEAQKERKGVGSVQAKPIYHEIVMHAIDCLQPRYISMITPSRWMAGGMSLGKYRERMIADRRIRLIQDFPGVSKVFSTVSIAGGVSYFLWDKDYSGECEFNGYKRPLDEFDIVVRDNMGVSILKKVLAKHPAGKFCDQKVLPRKPFGLRTNFKDWVPEGTPGSVKCYCKVKDGFEKWVLKSDTTDRHSAFNKWNVLTSAVTHQGADLGGGAKRLLSKLFVAEKGTVCLETYIVAASFDSQVEANNFRDYMRTKFYRYLLSLRVITQHLSKDRFCWVPFFDKYSKTWSDQELYQHFGLTRKEIDHIESTIKELK